MREEGGYDLASWPPSHAKGEFPQWYTRVITLPRAVFHVFHIRFTITTAILLIVVAFPYVFCNGSTWDLPRHTLRTNVVVGDRRSNDKFCGDVAEYEEFCRSGTSFRHASGRNKPIGGMLDTLPNTNWVTNFTCG